MSATNRWLVPAFKFLTASKPLRKLISYYKPLRLVGDKALKSRFLSRYGKQFGLTENQIVKIKKHSKYGNTIVIYKIPHSNGHHLSVVRNMSNDKSGSFIEIYKRYNKAGNTQWAFKVKYSKSDEFVDGRLIKTSLKKTAEIEKQYYTNQKEFDKIIDMILRGEI